LNFFPTFNTHLQYSAPRAVEASSPIIATKSSGVDNVTSTQAYVHR